MGLSVQPEWMTELPLQQQSVLMLAARGPDGIGKGHPCKEVQRCYRATVLMAARYGRMLQGKDRGDSFMSLWNFIGTDWRNTVKDFMHSIDELPHHYLMHLMHGVQILAYKHPDLMSRSRWLLLYMLMVEDMHLSPESEEDMDARLSDWGRQEWDAVDA